MYRYSDTPTDAMTFPVALILYRSGDEDVKRAIREELVPLLSSEFACLFIEGASNKPGDIGYWFHLYHLLASAVDIVLVFDVYGDSYSENIFFEQFILRTENKRGQITRQVLEYFEPFSQELELCARPYVSFFSIGYDTPPSYRSQVPANSFSIKTAEGEDPLPYYAQALRKIKKGWQGHRTQTGISDTLWALRDAYSAVMLNYPVIKNSTTLIVLDGSIEPRYDLRVPKAVMQRMALIVNKLVTDDELRKHYAKMEELEREQISSDAVAKEIASVLLEEVEKKPSANGLTRLSWMLKAWLRARKVK